MREKLKDLKVKQKLQKSYFTILAAFILTLILAIVGLATINVKLKSFYEESYRNTQLQLEIRKDIQMVGKNVLWAVTMEDETNEYSDANEHSFRKFRAPLSGKTVHVFPEVSAMSIVN